MQANDLIDRVEELDPSLARDLRKFVNGRKLGLIYEESKPEYVRLTNKPVVVGDLVNLLPPRGTMEDMFGVDDSDVIWRVLITDETGRAVIRSIDTDEIREAAYDDLVAVARFDQTIYCGLKETGRVERGGADKPCHAVINGENFHALELLMFPYQGKVDCIYIDPPYNTGAKDWKYNNNYVGTEDTYRHSKWLTFMEDRLRLAKKLLNPKKSVLICTIDEKEYLRLGLLLEQMFPRASIQMVSSVINPKGSARAGRFSRVDEYLFFVMIGDAFVVPQSSDMLHANSQNKKRTVRWAGLMRNGEGSRRTQTKSLFYPIFFDIETGHYVSCGDSLPLGVDRNSVEVPEGLFVVWPLDSNGEEMKWRLYPPTFREYVKKGYVRFGKYEPGSNYRSISYLQDGMLKKISSGDIVVTGKDDEGALEVAYKDDLGTRQPTTLWNMVSHSASEHGASFIKDLLPGRRFTYPKSLYAVEDTLRFFVANNPDALIVDFFSGSGTTTHATMRLNHQDGGRRRSISVTNNEVSFEEAKAFVKQGLRAGDPEWESHGIARYVTIPRVTAAITGLTPEGEPIKSDYKFTDEFPMSDGFEENAVFYDLTYIEPSVLKANLAFDEIAPLLWMRAGSVGPVITLGGMDPDDATYEVTDTYGVLFNYAYAPEFVEECKAKDVGHIFIVTDVDRQYRDMCAEFKDRDVKQLYKSYLRSFEIGQSR